MDIDLFFINQQSISLSTSIGEAFRRQSFFKGTSSFTRLLKNLNIVADYIFSHDEYSEFVEEMQLILPALLDTQSNQDYILQADILEGDLLPLLQKIQIKFQECDKVQIPDFFDVNMDILEKYVPEFSKRFKSDINRKNEINISQFKPVLAVNGQPTLQAMVRGYVFYMHSSINPEHEAKLLIDSIAEADNYAVLGMGLGYPVKELLSRYPEAIVTVYESNCDIIKLALSYIDWTNYIEMGRLRFVYDHDMKNVITKLSTDSSTGEMELLVHYPTIKTIEDEKIRQLLEDFFITTSSMREQGTLLDSNFKIIEKHNLPECSAIRELFKNRKVVIVGAGPSANMAYSYLKKYRDEFIIFATGHIVRSLVREDIIPDVIMLTDPQPHMYKQIEGIDLKNIPLILLSTGSSSILDYYMGPIYVAYQNGYAPAENKAQLLGTTKFETGGSVTTTALDISIRFGAKEIIFAGVDLAYTGGYSHVIGEGRKIEDNTGLRKVKGCTGEMVYTSKNLDIYRKWIEKRIEGENKVEFINTGAGAYISGTVWKKWEQIV